MTRTAMRMLTAICLLAGIAPQLAAADSIPSPVGDDSVTAPLLPPLPLPTASDPPATASPSPFHYCYQPPLPPDDEPHIIEIDLTDRIMRPGPMELRVLTDPNVTSVAVRTMGRAFEVPQQSTGIFAASATVPQIPFFLKGRTYWVDFVATRPDGHQTVVSLPVVLN
jgi:hypothetical protein